MGRMKTRLIYAVGFLVLAGCSQAPAPLADSREADAKSLRAAQDAAIKAFESRDAGQMLAAYSPDATLMLPNVPALNGAGLQAALKDFVADPNFSMRFTTAKVEVAISGEIGYTRGAYTMTTSDPKTGKVLTEKGKYLTIYAKQADGTWKIIEDINNADAPAAPAAATQ